METIIQISQFIMSLSLLIVLHELGHFIPAKLFKTKVEKFYLFFDWPFSLFKKKFGDTEYGIGILPLGGYVKIAGMIDESMDQEQLNKKPEEWEFRSKPTWQRLIIMVGGVTVNLILGFLIYMMILFVWGDGYISNDKIPYGAHLSSPVFESYGFQEGDLIVEVGGEKIIEFGTAEKRILIDGERNIKIKRNEEIISLTLSENIVSELLKNKGAGILSDIRFYNTIDSLIDGNNAVVAGFNVGDSIVGINGMSTPFFRDFKNELEKYKSQEVEISFYRNDLLKSIKVNTNEDGTIGYFKSNNLERSVTKTKKYSILEAIPSGINKGTETLANYVKSLSLIFFSAIKFLKIG